MFSGQLRSLRNITTYVHRSLCSSTSACQAEVHKHPISLSRSSQPIFLFFTALPALPTQLRPGSPLSTHHAHRPPRLYLGRAVPCPGHALPVTARWPPDPTRHCTSCLAPATPDTAPRSSDLAHPALTTPCPVACIGRPARPPYPGRAPPDSVRQPPGAAPAVPRSIARAVPCPASVVPHPAPSAPAPPRSRTSRPGTDPTCSSSRQRPIASVARPC
jgi:hypothetical protein